VRKVPHERLLRDNRFATARHGRDGAVSNVTFGAVGQHVTGGANRRMKVPTWVLVTLALLIVGIAIAWVIVHLLLSLV
jgi:hypothetical protein